MQCPSCYATVDGTRPFCSACGAPLPRQDADPLIGCVIQGKYKIARLLGEGGMGAVYAGEQALGHTTRRVAIKTLHRHLSNDPQIRERFYREAGTLAGLEHPNTVQVFDFGTTDDGVLYIVMEFVQGESIAAALEKIGPLPLGRAKKILEQICGSLGEAHDKGIIHRDLKPDNVILTERAGQKDFVKVLDFGIAKRNDEEDRNEAKLTQQGMVLGTPPYMSPEQFTGQPLDRRADIYSLGVMAYEMLTGELPFTAKSSWEWATLHMTSAPKPIETTSRGAALPESVRSAIMCALSKAKEQRFSSVQGFFGSFCGAPRDRSTFERTPTAIDRPATVPAVASGARGNERPAVIAPSGDDSLKGGTQIGEPISLPEAGFGGASLAPSYGMQPSAMAYGVHSSVPYAPPLVASGRKGKGRFALLVTMLGIGAAIAAVGVYLASTGAIGGGTSSGPAMPIAFDAAATTPTPTPTVAASTAHAPLGTSAPLTEAPPLPGAARATRATATLAAAPPQRAATPASHHAPGTPASQHASATPATPTPPSAQTPSETSSTLPPWVSTPPYVSAPAPTPTPTPTPPYVSAPTPTPTPRGVPAPQAGPAPYGEPAVCARARSARASGMPIAIVNALEARCRAEGDGSRY
ncbi:MAG: protein kinase [Polyangiaceae bacterium]|nr:protein kinase [Polyangiaceae bacterium]